MVKKQPRARTTRIQVTCQIAALNQLVKKKTRAQGRDHKDTLCTMHPCCLGPSPLPPPPPPRPLPPFLPPPLPCVVCPCHGPMRGRGPDTNIKNCCHILTCPSFPFPLTPPPPPPWPNSSPSCPWATPQPTKSWSPSLAPHLLVLVLC